MPNQSDKLDDVIVEAEAYLTIVAPLQQLLINEGIAIFSITRGTGQNGYIQFSTAEESNLLIAEISSNNGLDGVKLSRSGIEQLLVVGFMPPAEQCPNYMATVRIESNADLEAVASMVQHIFSDLYKVDIGTEVETIVLLD